MRIPILVGEICHNLRSALDYLVFELARHDANAPQKDTQFPIVDTPEKFRSQRAKRLKGVNDRHVGMIGRLQPYNGCDWTRALREISNRGKHREFVTMRGMAAGMAYVSTDPEYGSLALPILRVQHPTAGEMVEVKVDLSYAVHFADGRPVMEMVEVSKRRSSKRLRSSGRSSGERALVRAARDTRQYRRGWCAGNCVVQGLPASDRARPGRDGCSLRCRHFGSRLARSLVCSQCGSREIDMVLTGTER
jgi:hypothetical protein